MTAPIDKWLDGDSPGSAAHIHAVGAFAIFYNDLELSLYGLFRLLLPTSNGARNVLFGALHNRGRVDFLAALADGQNDPDLRDQVLHALACFDICCENRNLILHALSDADSDTESLRLVKLGKGGGSPRAGTLTRYQFTLEDIRAAALSASACETYIALIIGRGEGRRPSWPAKPPKPRKLSLSRLTEALGAPLQPPPSQGKRGRRQ